MPQFSHRPHHAASARGPVVQNPVVAENVLAVVAAGWGVLMAVSPAFQIRRILQRQSSEDVSIPYLVIITVGFTVWVAYGVVIGRPALVIPNAVAFVVGVVTIAVVVRHRR
jgi:MtN3 and saliva related transmembrane protein